MLFHYLVLCFQQAGETEVTDLRKVTLPVTGLMALEPS